MAKRAKDLLGVDDLEVLADMGYSHGKEVKACLEAGYYAFIPSPEPPPAASWASSAKNDFRYALEQDCYWCPAGQMLTFRFQTTEKDRDIKYYASSACSQCPIKDAMHA